ncbi:MAG: winged helix-turn-helix domain-containing protein [Sphingomonadales bacterium]|jgi:TolB-like protein/DNA-binding winged helix-turn-helix (wHTH) protein
MQSPAQKKQGEIRIAQYTIDLDRNVISGPDGEKHLEPKVIELAAELATHPGDVMSRGALIDKIWNGAYGADQCLGTTISRLRKALKDDAHTERCIETIPKRGYRLIKSPLVQTPPLKEVYSGKTLRIAKFFGLFILIALIALGAIFSFWAPSAYKGAKLAILPLENISNDPDEKQFAQGLLEQISHDIDQKLPIHILSQAGSDRFNSSSKSLLKTAQKLNLDYILEGTVRKTDQDTLRTTLRLVDVQSGFNLWTRAFNSKANLNFPVQQDIATQITDQMQALIEHSNLDGASDNQFAIQAYLRGVAHFRRYSLAQRVRQTRDYLLMAQEEFSAALDYDPDMALAHARLGMVYIILHSINHIALNNIDAGPLEQARYHINRAMSLDPDLGLSYLASGWLIEAEMRPSLNTSKTFFAAKSAYEKATQLSPNNYEAFLSLAQLDIEHGMGENAQYYIEQAQKIAPVNRDVLLLKARLMMWQGRYEESRLVLKNLLELYPDYIEAHVLNGRLYRSQGNFIQAYQAYLKGLEYGQNTDINYELGQFYLELDQKDIASEYFAKYYGDNWEWQRHLIDGMYPSYLSHLLDLIKTTNHDQTTVYLAMHFAWTMGDLKTLSKLYGEYFPTKTPTQDIVINMNNISLALMTASLYADMGQQEAATTIWIKVRDYLLNQKVFQHWAQYISLAEIYSLLGDEASALKYLEKALYEGPNILYNPKWWSHGVHLKDRFSFQNIQSTPEFSALIEQALERRKHVFEHLSRIAQLQ